MTHWYYNARGVCALPGVRRLEQWRVWCDEPVTCVACAAMVI